MTNSQWDKFSSLKNEFKAKCDLYLNDSGDILPTIQKEASKLDYVPEYPIQTPVVYNRDLDNMTQNSDIKLIVIGDNPGKDEQLEKNRRYLVGQSGKIAQGFFERNPELNIDFRKNVIILNKTPVHSAKTKELKYLASQNMTISNLIMTSQIFMSEFALKCQILFDCPIWIIGYAEMKKNGIFEPYRENLEKLYSIPENMTYYDKLFVFQHFSMNRFLIDLKTKTSPENMTNSQNKDLSLAEKLSYLGRCHRNELFSLSILPTSLQK